MAVEILHNNGISLNILVDHIFNTNFVRLNITNKDRINSLSLTDQQKSSLNTVYDLYKKDEALRQSNIQKFMHEWDKLENLKNLGSGGTI